MAKNRISESVLVRNIFFDLLTFYIKEDRRESQTQEQTETGQQTKNGKIYKTITKVSKSKKNKSLTGLIFPRISITIHTIIFGSVFFKIAEYYAKYNFSFYLILK